MDGRMERAVRELRRTVTDAEALLEAGGERLGEARSELVARLDRARDRLIDIEREVAHRGRRAAREVDRYAHGHPWQVAGIGVALAVAIALAACLVFESRRD
jgi:ElaB/YqjD/DUF883 family membrane-anchored ribosome-binding protein